MKIVYKYAVQATPLDPNGERQTDKTEVFGKFTNFVAANSFRAGKVDEFWDENWENDLWTDPMPANVPGVKSAVEIRWEDENGDQIGMAFDVVEIEPESVEVV